MASLAAMTVAQGLSEPGVDQVKPVLEHSPFFSFAHAIQTSSNPLVGQSNATRFIAGALTLV